MAAINITFNNYDLQDANIVSSKAEHTHYPAREIDLQRKVRDDGFDLLANYFTMKRIVVEGTIKGSSVADLRTRVDTMKKNLVGEEKVLEIDYGSSTRQYIATVEDLQIFEEYFNLNFFKYRVVFLCQWYGRDSSATTREYLNLTAATVTSETTIDGTLSPRPIITITIDSETAMTMIQFVNTTTDEEIEVEQAFTAADSLVIDTNNLTVKLNGTEVDFIGIFPSFLPGTNGWKIKVHDTGAFQVDVSIQYTPYYS